MFKVHLALLQEPEPLALVSAHFCSVCDLLLARIFGVTVQVTSAKLVTSGQSVILDDRLASRSRGPY